MKSGFEGSLHSINSVHRVNREQSFTLQHKTS